jgi:hypothetical protein
MTRIYTDKAGAQGRAWAIQAGAAFSNPFTIELARDRENTPLIRCADYPAFRALREIKNCQELASRKNTGHARLAGMAGFLKRHLEACLRGDLQNSRSICAANKTYDFSASPSVLIRAIRG